MNEREKQKAKQKKTADELFQNIDALAEQDEDQIFNDKHLKKMLNQVVEAILSQNRYIFDFYEQIISEVDQMQLELDETKKELAILQPRVDSMRRNEQALKQHLSEASSKFREDDAHQIYLYLLEAKEDLRIKDEEEARLRKKRNALEIKLKKFRNMERMAKTMVTTIGSVATFLNETFSAFADNFENMQSELEVNAKIINAHETERLRISRELHDTVAQDLSALLFEASLCKMFIEKDEKETAIESLGKIREGIQGGVSGVRQAIFDMRPMSIDDLGLIGALKELIQSTSSRYNLKIDLRMDGDEPGRGFVPAFKELAIYRIIQEIFTNIIHHANASRVDIFIVSAQQAFTITIKDNGDGFNSEEVLQRIKVCKDPDDKHYGLLGMYERARQIGAELSIDSKEGFGAKLRLRLPLG